MQTPVVEQILFWPFADPAVLWVAGAEQRDHFRGVSHRPFLSLEFWGLPEPHDSTAVDWSPLLFDILHIR